jgi:citrate lyase subunit beta/citryl-CoA lyase
MFDSPPLWRSQLFVPANRPNFVEKAHTRGADAIILDLEDSVPIAERTQARSDLADSITQARAGGADVLVRLNNVGGELEQDLAACEPNMPDALMIPKVESEQELARISGWLSSHKINEPVPFLVIIESALGFLNMRDIAFSNQAIVAMTLGGEDFALDVGMKPTVATLEVPMQLCLYTARAANLMPLGIFGSIAEYSDLDEVRANALRAKEFGFEGAACIHPSVVPILNDVFSPSDDEVGEARRIVEAYATAQASGLGAIELDGNMIDVPIALRAQGVLDRYQRIMESS